MLAAIAQELGSSTWFRVIQLSLTSPAFGSPLLMLDIDDQSLTLSLIAYAEPGRKVEEEEEEETKSDQLVYAHFYQESFSGEMLETHVFAFLCVLGLYEAYLWTFFSLKTAFCIYD